MVCLRRFEAPAEGLPTELGKIIDSSVSRLQYALRTQLFKESEATHRFGTELGQIQH